MSMENGTIYNPFLIDSWEGYPLLLLRFHTQTLLIFLIGNTFFFFFFFLPLWRAHVHLYCSININGISQRWIISLPVPEHGVNEASYLLPFKAAVWPELLPFPDHCGRPNPPTASSRDDLVLVWASCTITMISTAELSHGDMVTYTSFVKDKVPRVHEGSRLGRHPAFSACN